MNRGEGVWTIDGHGIERGESVVDDASWGSGGNNGKEGV